MDAVKPPAGGSSSARTRARIASPALLAVLLLCGVALACAAVATGASAALPEYYVCGKAEKVGKTYTGSYANASCSQPSDEAKGRFELESWEHAKKKTFKTRTGPTTLDTFIEGIGVVGEVACKKDAGSGEITGPTTTTETIVFEGCSDAGKACSSAEAKPGDVVTDTLDGELGTIAEGTPPRIGVEYTGGGPEQAYARFDCEGLQLELHGSVIGEITGDVEAASKDLHVVYAVNESGEPTIASFQGAPPQSLLAEVVGVGTFGTGWANPDVVESEPVILEPPCLNSWITPAITMQPADVTVQWPDTATFITRTACAPRSVEWERGFTPIAGATKMFYRIKPTHISENGDEFRACYTYRYSISCTRAAKLTVIAPPCAYAPLARPQPQSVTVTEGQPAKFTTNAQAAENCQPVSAQWESEATNANTFSAIAGAVQEQYEIPSAAVAESGTKYRVCLTDSFGTRCSTSNAVLTVTPAPCSEAPEITTALSNVTVTAPAAATFKAAARTPAHCTVEVEWSKNHALLGDHTDEYKIATTSTAESGSSIEACFSDGAGTRCTAATLTVNAAQSCSTAPKIIKSVNSVSVEEGEDAVFEAEAQTPTPCEPMTVTWQEGNFFLTSEPAYSGVPVAVIVYDAQLSQFGAKIEACFKNRFGVTCSSGTLYVTL